MEMVMTQKRKEEIKEAWADSYVLRQVMNDLETLTSDRDPVDVLNDLDYIVMILNRKRTELKGKCDRLASNHRLINLMKKHRI